MSTGLSLVAAQLCRPMPGESQCGDAALVRTEGEMTLLALVDGLGHGPAAAEAATRACAYLSRAPLAPDPAVLLTGVHAALAHTRGAAATICVFDGAVLRGAGIGNVTLRALGSGVPALLTSGVLGQRLGRLRTFEAVLRAGDRIMMFTDGISPHFDLAETRSVPAAAACTWILAHHARATDDAGVLVADVFAERTSTTA